jgi:Heparan-alpha-glucosaminide N-acetyltransferase, catalytic
VNGRVIGVDVARCLALLGMMATHVLPDVVDGEVPVVHQVAAGRSSALFAVLAGVSLVLVTGSRGPVRGPAWRAAYAGLAARAGVIGLIGLLLGEVRSGIAVILAYYAVFFLLAGPFLALRSRWVLLVAAVWAAAGPVASFLLRRELPDPTYAVPSVASLFDPVRLVLDLLVTGYYPALTWLPYLLLGIAVGRLDLGSVRARVGLVVGGAAAVLAAVVAADLLTTGADVRAALVRTFEGPGWQGDLATTLARGLYGTVPTGTPWWLAVRAPHTGTTPDLLLTAGSACLVLALCLVVADLAPEVCRVLFGAGGMTLTLYSLHVISRAEGFWDADGWPTYLGQVAAVLAIGAAYALARRRGPLERVVGDAARAARLSVERAPVPSVPDRPPR